MELKIASNISIPLVVNVVATLMIKHQVSGKFLVKIARDDKRSRAKGKISNTNLPTNIAPLASRLCFNLLFPNTNTQWHPLHAKKKQSK